MKYQKVQVYEHLAKYKLSKLKVIADGIWTGNGESYRHILPEGDRDKNLITDGYGTALVDLLEQSRIKKHSGFHHLNSSQAMAFNLFAPFLKENSLEYLLKLLGDSEKSEFSEFEHIENNKEFTNFDFFVRTRNTKYFFEVKYTEDGFGSPSLDDYHHEKFEKIYRQRLNQISNISEELFFKNYQLWRNLIYSLDGVVVFVYPRFRKDIEDKIDKAKSIMFDSKNVKILHVEDICAESNDEFSNEARSHYQEFRKKYLEIEFA